MNISLNILTNSSLRDAKKCRRLYQYRHQMLVRSASEAKPLRIGGCFHKGVEYKEKLQPHQLAHQEEEAQSIAIADAVASYETLPAWANDDAKIHDWMIEREIVANMLAGYFWRWSEDTSIAKVIATELAFNLPIINPDTGKQTPNYRLAGKIDSIVELSDGRLAIREMKTAGEDISQGSKYWRRLRIDHQISTYYYAAQQLGYPVKTVLYDVARKPEIEPRQIPLVDEDGVKIVLDASGQRVRTKDGKKWRETGDAAQGFVQQTRIETPEEFGKRYLDDIFARPDYYFAREEIPRLQADIDEFLHELWDQQQELREAVKSERWYRNTNSCVGFGTCEFFDVCTNGIAVTRENPPAGFVAIDDPHPELST